MRRGVAVVWEDLRGFVSCWGSMTSNRPSVGITKFLRKNADDGDGRVVERNGAAENARLAGVARLPKVVGEQSDAGRVESIFIARESCGR